MAGCDRSVRNLTSGPDMAIIDAHIEHILGQRWLRDLKVTTINSFYRHLREWVFGRATAGSGCTRSGCSTGMSAMGTARAHRTRRRRLAYQRESPST
jgi:hypothetical protein